MSRGYLAQNSARLGSSNNVVVAMTSTAAASAVFGTQTYQIRISAQAACYYKVGDGTPTANTSDVYLPANIVEYVTVTPGQKISAFSPTIQTVSVVEVTG